jgi:hypothetical protein
MTWPMGAGDRLVVPVSGGIVIVLSDGAEEDQLQPAAKAEWVPASVATRVNADNIFLKSMGYLSGREIERWSAFPSVY